MEPEKDLEFYKFALDSAKLGLKEGGIPIGAALYINEKLVSVGRNQRIQKNSAIHHGETNCIENAGRLKSIDYKNSTLYTTLSPCSMCAGTIRLYGIPRVVIGENKNYKGDEEILRNSGVELVILNDNETIHLMSEFIKNNGTLWNEDIGI